MLKQYIIGVLLLISYGLNATQSAKIIAFAGLSGCGKSTMARLLAEKNIATAVIEPEEDQFHILIQKRDIYGYSSGMLAFRQMWLEMFMNAHQLKIAGDTVILDGYFFKIYGYYLGKPGLEWLLAPNDPYLPLLKELNVLDEQYIPDADCVILFDISLEDWKKCLHSRGRDWDKQPGFEESYAITKRYIDQATIDHCKRYNIRLVIFEHYFGDINEQAQRLISLLQENNII